MKRLKVILLLLLFAHSKMGMALNFHYCGNHLASVSLAVNPKGCGMETSKSNHSKSLTFSQKSCCVDDIEIFQSTEDINFNDDGFDLGFVFVKQIIKNKINEPVLALGQNIQLNERPPPLKIPLYRLYGSFVFYE